MKIVTKKCNATVRKFTMIYLFYNFCIDIFEMKMRKYDYGIKNMVGKYPSCTV